MGLRMALWFGFAAVAGAFGGLVAFGVEHAHAAIANWRLLFIVEVCGSDSSSCWLSSLYAAGATRDFLQYFLDYCACSYFRIVRSPRVSSLKENVNSPWKEWTDLLLGMLVLWLINVRNQFDWTISRTLSFRCSPYIYGLSRLESE
jgi:hypothetical protein